jgi:lipopolysaccharide export system permease protein
VIIFRYLAKEIYASVSAVMIVLLLIFISNQLIRYLAMAAAGKIPGGFLLQLMLLQIPHLLGILLPLAFYLAILLAYGRLYADSELMVLQANGFSLTKLMGMTLLIGIGVFIPVTALNVWLEPAIAKQKDFILAQVGAKALLQTIMPGRFHMGNDGKRIYYVEAMSRDRTHMKNIFIAENSPFLAGSTPQTEWWVVTAESAYAEADKKTGDSFLVLQDGHRYLGKPNSKDYEIVDFSTYKMRLHEHRPSTVSSDVEASSTANLWRQRKVDPNSAAEFHWRISKSIAVFILGLLAVPLSRVNPRQGKYGKLLPAILIFVLYFNLLLINQEWIVKQTFSWRVGMWPTHLLIALLGLWLFINALGLRQFIFSRRNKA